MAQITVNEGQPTFKPIQITHTIESADELAAYICGYMQHCQIQMARWPPI